MNWKELFEKFYEKSDLNDETSESYVNEWKRRFESGWEWQHSDYRNRKILQNIASDVYPKDLDTYFHRE